MKKMTPRERIRAVVRGEMPDRVPFVQYENTGGPDEEVWAELGRENMGTLRWTKLHRLEFPNCPKHVEHIQSEGTRGTRTTIETPKGPLVEAKYYVPNHGAACIREHFVREPEDYDRLLAYLEDGVVVEDLTEFHLAMSELGEQGLPLVAVERSPYQQLWVQWVCIEDLAWHFVECPERVHACINALGKQERQVMAVAARSPAEFVGFPDNITAPMIGEQRFREFCVPFYDELAAMLGDRPVYVHMDGDLKVLWDAISKSGVGGIDSMSPPPDNDTSAKDAVTAWPMKRVWANFPSSVHLKTASEIHDKAVEILDQAGHTGRLQIQISETMPPGVWRKSFPQIMRAIEDFGQP